MSSPTLKMIMKHWSSELPADAGFIELPFDVESFCAENDRLHAAIELAMGHHQVTHIRAALEKALESTP